MWPFKKKQESNARDDRARALAYEAKCLANKAGHAAYEAKQTADKARDDLQVLTAQVWWDNNAHGYDGHWGMGKLLFHGRNFMREVEDTYPMWSLGASPGWDKGLKTSALEAGKLNKQYGYMNLQEWLEYHNG